MPLSPTLFHAIRFFKAIISEVHSVANIELCAYNMYTTTTTATVLHRYVLCIEGERTF